MQNKLRRFRNGLQFQGNYTYGKVLSDSDGTASHRFEEFRDPSNGKIDRSRPTFDVTHAIKGNAVYELPFGVQRWRPILSGWTVSGIVTYQNGLPFSITDSTSGGAFGGGTGTGLFICRPLAPVVMTK